MADSESNTIRKITPAGVVTTLAGTAGVAAAPTAPAAPPASIVPEASPVDGSGNVYVADFGNNTIRKITPAGVVTTLAGTAGVRGSADGTGAGAASHPPSFLALGHSSNLYVTDRRKQHHPQDHARRAYVPPLAGTAGHQPAGRRLGPARQSFYGASRA